MHQITGRVVRGNEYGRKIGFPTVNLESGVKELPRDGIYSGIGVLKNKEYRAGIVIGPEGKIEAHLIDFDGDAYGEVVTLRINKFLREFKKFETETELINQIKEDLKQC